MAEADGYPEVARFFRAIAYAERVHATNHLRELEDIGDTAANLKAAGAGEIYEVEQMYPAFKEVTKLQAEKGAIRSTHYALEAEKLHIDLYHEAEEMVLARHDVEARPVCVCPVCGYTVVGDHPPSTQCVPSRPRTSVSSKKSVSANSCLSIPKRQERC